MRSSIDIDVDAAGTVVFELARDVARWPVLLPHYRKVTVVSREEQAVVAVMRAVRPIGRFGIPVRWRSRVWAETDHADDLRLRFLHTGGATRGMDVTWHITPRGPAASNVAIVHDFSRKLPFLGSDVFPTVVDRLFVRPIAGRTLTTFKRLAELQA